MIRKQHSGGTKHCAKCDNWIDLTGYHKNRRNWDGLHAYCSGCMGQSSRARYQRDKVRLLEQSRAYRIANPDRRKDILLRSRFGISLSEYQKIEARQHGVCAICHLPGRLNVDHCHKTLAVRGLLCTACNTAIGALGDDPERIRAAAAYVEAAR